jgi:hypothetical protein
MNITTAFIVAGIEEATISSGCSGTLGFMDDPSTGLGQCDNDFVSGAARMALSLPVIRKSRDLRTFQQPVILS